MTQNVNKIGSSEDAERHNPEDAVIVLQEWFLRRAGRMTRENRSFVDDLAQEMSLAVLQCIAPQTLYFFKGRAVSRARDFLRAEDGRLLTQADTALKPRAGKQTGQITA